MDEDGGEESVFARGEGGGDCEEVGYHTLSKVLYSGRREDREEGCDVGRLGEG